MPTPHIEAKEGQIAEIVFMPGDPLRAKFMVEKYLTDAVMFNDDRNMFGYTGFYKGKRISVMGSGMGMASMGIYSYELFNFYNVKQIIRVGTCGSVSADINVGDVVLVNKSVTNSTYALQMNGEEAFEEFPSSRINNSIKEIAIKNNINIYEETALTSDVFNQYTKNSINDNCTFDYKVCEMEAFALFHNARILKKEAACLLTVSDSIFNDTEIAAIDREKSLTRMIELALDSI